MNDKTFEKAYKQGGDNMNKFTKAATYITEHYIGELPNHPLTTEDRNTIMECMAADMAAGAELVKCKYLIIGALIGASGLYLATKVIKKFTKKVES
ncbi:MAG: hypothetical protein LBT06_10865 [Hungatella sp.]|jgi:hypothetical protein|nr:hypothetical protein [Hungatella sp.]